MKLQILKSKIRKEIKSPKYESLLKQLKIMRYKAEERKKYLKMLYDMFEGQE